MNQLTFHCVYVISLRAFVFRVGNKMRYELTPIEMQQTLVNAEVDYAAAFGDTGDGVFILKICTPEGGGVKFTGDEHKENNANTCRQLLNYLQKVYTGWETSCKVTDGQHRHSGDI